MNSKRAPVSRIFKQHSADPDVSSSNPFDLDSDFDRQNKPPKTSSAPAMNKAKYRNSQDETRGSSSLAARNKYKNDFRDSGGIENQSVQELENYASYKTEETTHRLNGALKIAEEIREDASKTLVTLHQQGQQITRTHQTAADIDYELSRGEKLLGNLGGIFSKKWKPKKTHEIKGPMLTKDDSFIRRGNHLEQRQKLGLAGPLPRSGHGSVLWEPTSALEKVEVEKKKQDDALDDLSNVLGELKSMAIDMGSEIGRQNVALDHMQYDVEEISARVKGANQRGRRLLGK